VSTRARESSFRPYLEDEKNTRAGPFTVLSHDDNRHGRKLKLVECPVCGEPFAEHSKRSSHLLHHHEPGDFGLTAGYIHRNGVDP
jgi:hypothetical protein